MKYFKLTIYGDTMYYKAETLQDAKISFAELSECKLTKWAEVAMDDIPHGHDIMMAPPPT